MFFKYVFWFAMAFGALAVVGLFRLTSREQTIGTSEASISKEELMEKFWRDPDYRLDRIITIIGAAGFVGCVFSVFATLAIGIWFFGK